jgi:hypothetical protein
VFKKPSFGFGQDLLRLVVRGPYVLDITPRREECTICTALAPEAVFTVRTYGDTADKPKATD